MSTPYTIRLRDLATSILAAVQTIEEHDATEADDAYARTLAALTEADDAAHGLADWIAEGRPTD